MGSPSCVGHIHLRGLDGGIEAPREQKRDQHMTRNQE